jgi:hypothetical protein
VAQDLIEAAAGHHVSTQEQRDVTRGGWISAGLVAGLTLRRIRRIRPAALAAEEQSARRWRQRQELAASESASADKKI